MFMNYSYVNLQLSSTVPFCLQYSTLFSALLSGCHVLRRHTLSITSIEDIGISSFSCVLCQKMLLILFLNLTSDGFFWSVVKTSIIHKTCSYKRQSSLFFFYFIILQTKNENPKSVFKFIPQQIQLLLLHSDMFSQFICQLGTNVTK
ncbi:hypothetical protein HJG60_012103 [Phyllostomus discolor]|uniref:Uncharacterized protein n=1 Tax=Phyllostomus discolor TaxID=89673 RepID=A0A834DWE1_9CHIR|nr:hypothetical protein HJG60_012103 [Phyllostomus discolor]